MRKKRKLIPWESWSATTLEMLLFRCPLAYWFQSIEKLIVPQAIEKIFGEGVHGMFRKFFTLKNGYKSEKTFLGAWRYYWWTQLLKKKYKDMVKVRNKDDPEKFFATGVNILKRFYQENLVYRRGLLPMPEVEKSFVFHFMGHRVAGRKDRIQPLEDGGIAIVDYKTGLWEPKLAERRRNIQFTIYNLDHYLKTGQNPEEMWIELASSGKKISIPIRGEKDYLQLAMWLDEATMYVKNILEPSPPTHRDFPFCLLNPEDIKRKQFSPRPSSWCSYCDYEKACRKHKPGDSFRENWLKKELNRRRASEPNQLEFNF